MKALWIGAAIAIAAPVHAQVDVSGLLRHAVQRGYDLGRFRLTPPANPLEPGRIANQAQPTPEEPGALMPPSGELLRQGTFQILSSGEQRRNGDEIEVTGGADVVYRGYRIRANRVIGNLDTRIFTAFGDVSILGGGAEVRGDEVHVDFTTRRFRALKGEARLSPSFVKGQVLSDVFVGGETAEGDEEFVKATIAKLSTCTIEGHRHYEVDARDADVRPGKRLVLRHAKFKVNDKTLFSVPHLTIPLDERFYRYLPEVGVTDQDGYYLKARVGVPLPGENNLDILVDLFSKRGVALGGDLEYSNSQMSGNLNVYRLFGESPSLQLSANHRMSLGKNTLTFDGSFQQDNYLFAPQQTIISLRTGLDVPNSKGATQYSYLRNQNDSGTFNSLSETFGFNNRQRWNDRLNTVFDVAYSRDDPSSGSLREAADLAFTADQDLGRAQALLEYQRSIPIGESSGFGGLIDRTPVLTVNSDSRRLLGNGYRGVSFRSAVSMGEFVDGFSSTKVTRSYLDLDLSRPDNPSKRFRVDWNSRFRQGIYSDDTAQYILDYGATASYRLGRGTSANLRYSTSKPEGFSPLSIDQSSPFDLLSADVSFRPARTLLLGAETAYDFERLGRSEIAWQSVGVRGEWDPRPNVRVRGSSLYDTNRQAWSSVRLDLAFRPGKTYVGIGARYDGIRGTWSNANLFVDQLEWGRLNTSVLLQYNGYLKKFEARHFSFTYSLTDCWEVIFQIIDNPLGFRSGTQYGLYVRIKAFPFATPFGIGQRGQPLGIGTGRDF